MRNTQKSTEMVREIEKLCYTWLLYSQYVKAQAAQAYIESCA